MFFFFFFSSRRRHTRFDCDWSSDVCSSDLDAWNASTEANRQAGRCCGRRRLPGVRRSPLDNGSEHSSGRWVEALRIWHLASELEEMKVVSEKIESKNKALVLEAFDTLF